MVLTARQEADVQKIMAGIDCPRNFYCCESGFEGLDRALLKLVGSGSSPSDERFYDVIYPFLANNTEFSQAVSRYVPWVKSPDDLITMLDTYLIQDYANNIMKSRSFTDHEQSKMMMTCVLIQNDNRISDPWMEFLFTRGWEQLDQHIVGYTLPCYRNIFPRERGLDSNHFDLLSFGHSVVDSCRLPPYL